MLVITVGLLTLETGECCSVVETGVGREWCSVPEPSQEGLLWGIGSLGSFLLPLPSWLLSCWPGNVGPVQTGGEGCIPLCSWSLRLWSLFSARGDLQWHSSKACVVPSTCVHWASPLKPGSCLEDGVHLRFCRAHRKVKASLCSLWSSSFPLSLLCCESTSCLKISNSECSKNLLFMRPVKKIYVWNKEVENGRSIWDWRGYEHEHAKARPGRTEQPVLGCPGWHRTGHKVGVKDALIHSTSNVWSWIVPSFPAPGLSYLVKSDFLFFFFLLGFCWVMGLKQHVALQWQSCQRLSKTELLLPVSLCMCPRIAIAFFCSGIAVWTFI